MIEYEDKAWTDVRCGRGERVNGEARSNVSFRASWRKGSEKEGGT